MLAPQLGRGPHAAFTRRFVRARRPAGALSQALWREAASCRVGVRVDLSAPHRFEARIEPVGPFPPAASRTGAPLHLRITNAGDTTWLEGPQGHKGTVSVGIQQLRPEGQIANRDYFRISLPRSVTPGEAVEVRATVPLRPEEGRLFAIDSAAEHICWFSHHGSRGLTIELRD